jgi:hypothetical protein
MTEIKQIFVQHQKKMKKLIVHIGYPKTATTTLQINVFYNLYKSGKINFLGRATEAEDSVINNRFKLFNSLWMFSKLGPGIPLTEEERQEALDNYKERDHQEDINLLRGSLNQNSLNLYSDESLLVPCWRLSRFTSNPIGLKTIFDDGKTEIKILIVLRAQPKLMQSWFVQLYSRVFQKQNRKGLDTPSKLYFNEGQELELKAGEFSEIFNFYDVISSYSDIFGRDNVKILLFEDLVNDRPYFISQLSEILGVKPELINSYIENEKPQNVKTRKNEKYVLEKKHDNFLVRMLFGVQKALPKNIKSTLKKYTPLKTFLNNLLISDQSVEVPELTADEKKAIFEFYQKSNMLLADEFGISVEKLKKYQYI